MKKTSFFKKISEITAITSLFINYTAAMALFSARGVVAARFEMEDLVMETHSHRGGART